MPSIQAEAHARALLTNTNLSAVLRPQHVVNIKDTASVDQTLRVRLGPGQLGPGLVLGIGCPPCGVHGTFTAFAQRREGVLWVEGLGLAFSIGSMQPHASMQAYSCWRWPPCPPRSALLSAPPMQVLAAHRILSAPVVQSNGGEAGSSGEGHPGDKAPDVSMGGGGGRNGGLGLALMRG